MKNRILFKLFRLPYDIITNSYKDVVSIERKRKWKQYHFLINKKMLYIFSCHSTTFQIEREYLVCTIKLEDAEIIRNESRSVYAIENPVYYKYNIIVNT